MHRGLVAWRTRAPHILQVASVTRPRADVEAYWQRGWACLFATLEALSPADLSRTVTICQEPHTVVMSIDTQLSHYGYHVGQIVLIARLLAKENWTVLTIPRGGSEEYNRRKLGE